MSENKTPIHEPEQHDARRLSLDERREARVAAAQRAVGISVLLEAIAGRVAPGVLELFRMKLAQELAQQDFSQLYPSKVALWETPTMIANRWGVSVQRIARVITELGIRDPGAHPDLCEAYDNLAPNTARTVVCYRYSSEAVTMIERRLITVIEGAEA